MLIFFILLLVVFVVVYIVNFNVLTSLRQSVNEAWSDIDVQLKRRHDLIPNLINVVQGYAKHEQTIFEQTAALRTQAIGLTTENMSQKSDVETQLASNIRRVIAVGENYPDLKASENFLKLQDELTQTEDEIASSRRIYNDNVAGYNTKRSVFPVNIVARFGGFQQADFFQNEEK